MHIKPFPFLEEIISLYLLKRVAGNLGSSPLRIQVAQMIQSLYSTSITVTYIIKALHMELPIYPSLEALLIMTISIYYIIFQSDTYIDT